MTSPEPLPERTALDTSMRVDGDGASASELVRHDEDAALYEVDGQWLSEVQVRELLAANGIAVPAATQAAYDETVDEGSGWRFAFSPRWLAFGLLTLVFAAIGIGTIAMAIGWIVGDVSRHEVSDIDSPMTYILGAVLYLAVGVGIFAYVLREKHQAVNRLDPRLWIRELQRVRRRAGKPLDDAEMEDWILDHGSSDLGTHVGGAPAVTATPPRTR